MIPTKLFNCSRKGLYRRLPQTATLGSSLYFIVMIVINPFMFESTRMQIEEALHTSNDSICNNFFAETDKLIDNAKESYIELLQEESRTIRENSNSLKPNL